MIKKNYKQPVFFSLYLKAKYIAECLDEIKQELRQENMAVKSNAVNKLTYVSILVLKKY